MTDVAFETRLSDALTAGFAALTRGEGGRFVQPDLAPPFARLVEALSLDAAEAGLLTLLWAEQRLGNVAAMLADLGGVTVGLAAELIHGFHPGVLAPQGALRLFDLVAADRPVGPLARLTLDPAVADRLAGQAPRIPLIEVRVSHVVPGGGAPGMAQRLAAILTQRPSPVVLAEGVAPAVLAGLAAELGFGLRLIRGGQIPAEAEVRDRFARLWSREALFDAQMLVVEPSAGQEVLAADLVERVLGHVILTAPVRGLQRPVAALPVAAFAADPTGPWRAALGEAASRRIGAPMLWRLARGFRLDPAELAALGTEAAAQGWEADMLWRAAARAHAIPPLPGLIVQEPVYTWADMVLPPPLVEALKGLEAHVRHASTVFDLWGFDRAMGGRGRGVAALFAGPSGAGKTMAAEVLAEALGLRLMLIDLSQIISKYIGETAKNVAAAFVEAERAGAVMVWNEGDAIWGARGQVGHATDRHVNAETGDLLARIEAFQGVTIVTTNLRHAIDPAFLRRFRLVLDFPLPAEAERRVLWQRAFPPAAPLAPLNLGALAALPLSGGAIRNAALSAAILAAEAGGLIDRAAIERAIRAELAKTGQPMPQIRWGAA